MGLKGKPILQLLAQFYSDYKKAGELREKYIKALKDNSGWTRSSFLKFYVVDDIVKVEIYRDEGWGGAYSLRHTEILD